ncbi:hypothetical protein OS493_004567 [Desmophyllum pertusum]|uniref:DUF8077 domain-containing protein n=1 Tax=Desmophyllum pertusum TaxID=174260 RepID=A0A9W9ZGD2_9CNID|nr:hypothetical protein OS493_004567 [Desmophyllum pertusum]
MKTCTTVRMSSRNVLTLAALTSVNVNKTCTLLMENAEVWRKNETYKPPLPETHVTHQRKKRNKLSSSQLHLTMDLNGIPKKNRNFKEKVASMTTDYCDDNRTRCALKDSRRKRRSPLSELYTADQVHLLPGYPSNSSGSLQVAFYVQQPIGLFIGNISVLPRNTLVLIIITRKSELETAIGANISDVETLIKPTTPTTLATVKPIIDDWKWIAIGVGVGAVVIILILVFVFWRLIKRDNPRVKPAWDDSPNEQDGGMALTSYLTGIIRP